MFCSNKNVKLVTNLIKSLQIDKQIVEDKSYSYCNLHGSICRGTDFKNCRFVFSNLAYSYFGDCSFSDCDFIDCNFKTSNFKKCTFTENKFDGCNFFDASLETAKFTKCEVDTQTTFFYPICPDEGAFTAYKKVSADGKFYIAVLEIPADAQRSSATSFKCRASKAKVLRFENLDGSPADIDSAHSFFDFDFFYKPGETVTSEFEKNRFKECAQGIHFFLNRNLAVEF